MALLDVKTTAKVSVTFTLDEEVVCEIEAYAAFTGGTPDAVLEALPKFAFPRDKDYLEWRKANHEVPRTLTVTPASETTPTTRRRTRQTKAA